MRFAKRRMTAHTVLLVTVSYDAAPEYVGTALERRSVPFFRLDTDRFPLEVVASFDPQGDLMISDGERSISSKEVKSVWYRRSVVPKSSRKPGPWHSPILRTRDPRLPRRDPGDIANATLVESSSGYLARGAETISTCVGHTTGFHAPAHNRDE